MNHRLKKNARLNNELRKNIATAAVDAALQTELDAIATREHDLFEAVALAYAAEYDLVLEDARSAAPGVFNRVTALQIPFGRTEFRYHRNLRAAGQQFAPLAFAIRGSGVEDYANAAELRHFSDLDEELYESVRQFDTDRQGLAALRVARIQKLQEFMGDYTSIAPLLEVAPQFAEFVPAEYFDEPTAQITLDELMDNAA